MNISYNWLRALAPGIQDTPRQLADRLAMLGAPVDDIVELAEGIRDVLIARVDAVRPHPNADRLRICTVDDGSGETRQVVCGAPNVEAGGYYPFAPIGAKLPGGIEIKKAKLRGESSEGMLCSARELGLGRDHAGLMALAGEWKTGTSFVDQLGLDDARLEVDITPNRADLLSHLGIAREVAPGGVDGLRLPPFGPDRPPVRTVAASGEGSVTGIRVVVEDAAGCPRYMAAIVRGVAIAPSPEWLATRLRSVGLRPINNVVDATNYVLHELGQPLHAFDLDRIGGAEIRVRRARQGEALRTLDGVDRTLDGEVLVIADAERAVALAGVMGGQESEVTRETTALLVECARFDPVRVRKAARALGLSTDASYRFERGVDPELQPRALARVVELILAVAGGQADPELLDVSAGPVERAVVTLRPARVERLLGVRLDAVEIGELLRPLGLAVSGEGGELRVEVPGYRPDLTREVDLIEELARRRGYGSFPEELRPYRPGTVPPDPLTAVVAKVRATLGRWGFLEARSAGFAPAADNRLALLNPLSAEESHLRDSLLPGLLRRLEHNWAHGVRDIRLYEVGTVFAPGANGSLPGEEMRLALAFTGSSEPPHWSAPPRPFDVWDLKALAAELAEHLGLPAPRAASGSTAGPLDGSERFELKGGVAGRAAAGSVDAPAWAGAVYLLEVTLPTALESAAVTYRALPQYPAVERDLALLVPHGTEGGEVDRVVRGAAGSLLEELWPFDLYAGPGIAEGTRSLAWRLRFRRADGTLTDSEVDRAVDGVLRALGEELNVVRR